MEYSLYAEPNNMVAFLLYRIFRDTCQYGSQQREHLGRLSSGDEGSDKGEETLYSRHKPPAQSWFACLPCRCRIADS